MVYKDLGEARASSATGIVFTDYNSGRVFYPSKMKLSLSDVDLDSGRSASGLMIRHRKGVKRSLSLTFPPMTSAEMHTVLTALSTFNSGTGGGGTKSFFHVKYTDPLDGSSADGYRVTKLFYAGDRVAPVYNELLGLWEELTVDIVER